MKDIFVNYEDLKTLDHKIRAFSDEKDEWMPELKHIFLHTKHSEMYLVVEKKENELANSLDQLIMNWEERVLEYLNFECTDLKTRKYLKYNVTLIVLCIPDKNVVEENRKVFIKEEKSTNICRKIFLFCDNMGTVLEEELKYLPFYIESIKTEETGEAEINDLRKSLTSFMREATDYLDELDKKQEEKKHD